MQKKGEMNMGLFNILKKNGVNEKMLVLAEKPGVAVSYARAMHCNIKGDGYYEGDKYVITWSYGHLCTVYDPEDYDQKYKKWNMEHLPIIPNGFWLKVRNDSNLRRQFNIIKDLLKRNDITAVCIGTDPAREGELLGRYILMAIKNKKPVFRLWINNSLCESDIIDGFRNMNSIERYDNLFLAAQARDEIDWLVGVNFSRAYSLKERTQLTVGRCQTAVLSLICQREETINKFRSKNYYELTCKFSGGYNGTLCENGSTMIDNIEKAKRTEKEIDKEEGKITDVRRKTKSQDPPLLYNMTDIQRRLNRSYGYTADEVLSSMQQLYEEYKIISYPRTDSKYIKQSMVSMIPDIMECLDFGRFKNIIGQCKAMEKLPVERIVNDAMVTDHTAVIPVINEELPDIYEKLNEIERRVFDEIALNFLASFLNSYKYEIITILTKVKDYDFVSHGINVIESGWKALYKDNDVNRVIPEIKVGYKEKVESVNIINKKTTPPMRYTDDTLLEIMENPLKLINEKSLKAAIEGHGIGTSATRAGIIQNLIERNYVYRQKKYLVPSIPGMDLINSITIDKLKSVRFTAEVEEDIEAISSGKKSKDEVMKKIMKFIENGVDQIKIESKNVGCTEKKKITILGSCPFCGIGKVVQTRDGNYGCTEFKNGCRFYISKVISEVEIPEEQIKKLITMQKTDVLSGFKGRKGKFSARIVCDKKNKKTKFEYV